MSYEHGTTHYNLPQTEGSDTRDWFDTNEPFRAIDEELYSANQTAGQATQDIETVKSDISDLKDADTAMTGRVDGIEGRVTANELKIGRLETDVTDGIQDLKDSICAIEEASATAAYHHLTGEFFWYNDTLYKATANIAIGQQIVPDTNCRTTNITTELLEGAAGGVEIDDTVVSATKVWSSYKTNEEITNASAVKTGDTRWYSGKLQYYDGSAWVDAEIGGKMKTYYGTATATPAGTDIDISSLGFDDASDYYVIVNAKGSIYDTSGSGSGTSHAGFGDAQISTKTATSFTLTAVRDIPVSYQVVYNE